MQRATIVVGFAAIAVLSVATYHLIGDEQADLSLGLTSLNETWPAVALNDMDLDALPAPFAAAITNYTAIVSKACAGCQGTETYAMPLDDVLAGVDYLDRRAQAQGVVLGRPFEYKGVRFEFAYVSP